MLPSIALPGRFGDGLIKPSLACIITNAAWLLSLSYNCSTSPGRLAFASLYSRYRPELPRPGGREMPAAPTTVQ